MNSADNELTVEGSSAGAGVVWTNGSGDGLWSTAGNWQGGVVPGANDVATFDGSAVGNCTIDTTVNVAGIDITSGYTGTVSMTQTPGADGTGGTITHDGSYAVHTFTSSGTFTAPTGVTSAQVLVVAGGGSGGGDVGGGGGGGGLI